MHGKKQVETHKKNAPACIGDKEHMQTKEISKKESLPID